LLYAGGGFATPHHTIGWGWGGDWSWPIDYQHFSTNGK
jgi:hypothetical protein